MEDDAAPLGFSEVPPGKSKGQEHLKTKLEPHPPPDRPVYSVPEETGTKETSGEGESSGILPFAVGILGVAALMVASALFYSTIEKEPASTTPSAVAPTAGIASEFESLKSETKRTLTILDQAATEHEGEPEKLGEIEQMKQEAQSILDSFEEKN